LEAACPERVDLGACPRGRNAGRESRDRRQVHRAVVRTILCAERERRPELRPLSELESRRQLSPAWERKAPGHDADDRVALTAQRHRPSEDITRASESTLPERVRDHDDARRTWCRFVWRIRSPEQWLDA